IEGKTARVLSTRRYVVGPDALDDAQRLTHLIPLDVSSPTLLRMARTELVRLRQYSNLPVRVGFINVGEVDTRVHELNALLATQRASKLAGIVTDWFGSL